LTEKTKIKQKIIIALVKANFGEGASRWEKNPDPSKPNNNDILFHCPC
jgi:hypothetical protein